MATSVYLAAMVIVLTITILTAIMRLRKELQLIYFDYLSAHNKDMTYNFLRLRTVLICGIDKADLEGNLIRKELNGILSSDEVFGQLIDVLNILDYKRQFSTIREKRWLDYFRKLKVNQKPNPITIKWIGEKGRSSLIYERTISKLEGNLATIDDKEPKNSGYAFACFTTFEAIKAVKKHFKDIKQNPKRYIQTKYFRDVSIQSFVDVIDINWQNCSPQPTYKVSKFLWTVLIWFILIFFTTPTVK